MTTRVALVGLVAFLIGPVAGGQHADEAKHIKVKPDAVKFQVRSKLMILMDGDDSLQLDEKQLEEIYRPRTKLDFFCES